MNRRILNHRTLLRLATVLLLLLSWCFWGHVQTHRGLEFDWSSGDGFRHIDACPDSAIISRIIEGPYCFLVAKQSERFIVANLKDAGWNRATGRLAPIQVPYLPIVVDVRLDHFRVIDPTVSDLMQAASQNDSGRVRQLLKDGAQVNARDQSERTALMYACANRSSSRDLLEILLMAGADVNAVDRSGASALHAAVHDGASLTCIQALIAHGANPELADKSGNTPLILAIANAKSEAEATDAARLLEAAGASPSSSNHAGETAISWAEQLHFHSVIQVLASH